jgi:hypothetical protein
VRIAFWNPLIGEYSVFCASRKGEYSGAVDNIGNIRIFVLETAAGHADAQKRQKFEKEK